ncbi:hypothetical protein KFL_005070080 [Klebsormidium nitens]|uniref:PHD-type domain-containing protein n=1 Tax=Klebsormidium nitens TaxID=105231 RepID=A0A1Y1IJK0_KLENI|nr:hypothetical protein KFL_005070080 [Klebsormidium nitens]|eukprot:GAQ89291.1 hypothetical protein KFL_005070080 [Klebsormidium nitens]
MDAAKAIDAQSGGFAGPDHKQIAPDSKEASTGEIGKKSLVESSAWKRHDDQGPEQRRAAANSVVVRPPLAVASIFLSKEQRRRRKEESQVVADVDGQPEFDKGEGAPAKEGTPCREDLTYNQMETVNEMRALKAAAVVKAGDGDPSSKLAPLFLPKKTRVPKEKSFSKSQGTQENPANAGPLGAGKGSKRKRVEKGEAVLVGLENKEPPRNYGEVERELQIGSLKLPSNQTVDAKLGGVAEPDGRGGLLQSETVFVGGVKSKMETVVVGNIQDMGGYVQEEKPLNAAGEEGILEDAAAEKSTGKEASRREGSAGVIEGVRAAEPLTPAKRKRGRSRKATLSEAPNRGKGASERLGRGKCDAAALSKDAKSQGQADEEQAEPVSFQRQVEADPDSEMRPPMTETQLPSQSASFEKQENQGGLAGGMQQVEKQLSSALLQGAGPSAKAAVDAGTQQTVMKVPDIFLTANERKRRLQEAKKEEKRFQEEAAAAAEQAKLEKEALLVKAKEDKKRETEEKRQRAREEKAKQADEKKRLAREERAKGAEERKLKASKEKRRGASSAEGVSEMENGHDASAEAAEGGTPAKKKRGRVRKAKMETGHGTEVVVVLSGSEREETQKPPSLLDTMRKRQEDLRASIRESQEAHAKLNAGKATHPFFKRKQGPPADDVTPASTEAAPAKESKPSLAPLDPFHVTQRHEEDAPPLPWPERQLQSPAASPSNARLETHAPVRLLEPAHPSTSRSRVPGCETQLNLAQRQDRALGALLDFIQAKSHGEDSGDASEAVRQLTTEEALRRRFEWYKARAVQAQPDEAELGPESVSPDVSGAPLTDALWCYKYRPLSSQEVCGNPDGVTFIRDWLAEWTARIAREQRKKLLTSPPPPKPKASAKKWQASEESSDWLVSGGASDSDLRDDEDGLANVLLLSGPTGVGKTATVYALAEELEFHILESNPSEKRSRATILQRFGEATESKGLIKGNVALAGKTDPAKISNALLETLRKSATATAVARQPKAATAKRNTRKRPNVTGGPFAASNGRAGLSDSEVSAFVGSESSGSFGARGKGRKRRRKGKFAQNATGGENPVVDAEPQFQTGRVEEAANGTEAGVGELGGAKRPRKRRKTVAFVGLGKSESEGIAEAPEQTSQGRHVAAQRAAEGGHVVADGTLEDADVAGAPAAEGASPNGTRDAGPDGGGSNVPATGVERGIPVPMSGDGGLAKEQLEEASAEPNEERDVPKGEKAAAESGAFPPAYQRRQRGETGKESAPGGKVAGASVFADRLADGAIGDEVKRGGRQVANVTTAADDRPGMAEESEIAGHTGNDAIEAEPIAAGISAGVPTDSDGRKRKPDGVRRRRSGKLSEGSPPVKKRRSFGSPAVLSKVRTRPCSPDGEQGPLSVVPGGPVLVEIDTAEKGPVRKRVGKRRSSMDKGAKGTAAIKGGGPVPAGVNADVGGKGPSKGGSGSSKALLLFEEVEQQFEEDKGFLSAIATLAASTKRPMILTCNDSLEIPPGCDFRKLSVDFAAPPVLDLTVHGCLVAASEGSPVDPWVMERLVRVTKGDMRKVLLQAQLWSREPTPTDVHATAALPDPPVGGTAKRDASAGVHRRTDELKSVAEAPKRTVGVASMGLEAQTAVQRVGSSSENGHPERDTCPRPTHPRSLWPTSTVRELQLDAGHRSLPALADVALPCQLAAAVDAHQTLQTLRAAQVAERAAAVLAARVYGVLDAEEASAARIRKEIQEAKAAAKATEKAEVAERRRLAREAKRAARRSAETENEVGEIFGDGALLDDLEDVPIGRLSFCGNEAGVLLENTHVPGARKGRRGRRRAIEEDDDVSGGPCDVTPADGPAPEPEAITGRTESLAQALEESQVDQACGVCGSTDGEDAMLLCDGGGCQGALHMYCADPPLAEVPEGDWFCADCLEGREDEVRRSVAGRGAPEGPPKEGMEVNFAGRGREGEARLGGGPRGEEEPDGGDEQTRAEGGPVKEPSAGGKGKEERSAERGDVGKRLASKWKKEEQLPGDPVDVSIMSAAKGDETPRGEREPGETGGPDVRVEMPGPEDEARSGRAGTGPTEGHPGIEEELREGLIEQTAPQNRQGGKSDGGAEGARVGASGGGSSIKVECPVERCSQPKGVAAVIVGGVRVAAARDALPPEPQASRNAGGLIWQAECNQPVADCAPSDAPVDAAEASVGVAGASEAPPAKSEMPSDPDYPSLAEQRLAEIEPLRRDEMRVLVSAESREAVTTAAAVWGLADDLSASELMSQSGGGETAADAPPCDELDLGVPRQAAACLAYASLRWKLDTCHGAVGPKGGASDVELNSIVTVPGAKSEGELEPGGRQLLAAAGDEAALCGFLSGRGGAGERAWLRLRTGATAEQQKLERRTVDDSLREFSHREAAARRIAGLNCQMAHVEYSGFLGKMLTLEAERQHSEEGLRRSDRAVRPHLLDVDLSDELARALMHRTCYGVRFGSHEWDEV